MTDEPAEDTAELRCDHPDQATWRTEYEGSEGEQ